jgi:hypothetical protein
MRPLITVITITIVLNLIPAGSATAQTAQNTANDQKAKARKLAQATVAANLDDALMQLHIARTGRDGGGGVLVIPTAEEIKPQDLITIMEDITVMCRIFDKKLAQSRVILDPLFSGTSGLSTFSRAYSRDSSAGAMYVQGYGALFLTKVDFPLSPPPNAQEQETAEGDDADPLWTQTKLEIYAPDRTNRRKTDESAVKYDAEKVEDIKTTLVKALKHAANIRGLKTDESVILTVTGSGKSSDVIIEAIPGTSRIVVVGKDKKPRIYEGGLPDDVGASLPAVLVIRAKKSDIDAFSDDKLDFDEFRQKVAMVTHPYLPGKVERGRSPFNVRNRSDDWSTTYRK